MLRLWDALKALGWLHYAIMAFLAFVALMLFSAPPRTRPTSRPLTRLRITTCSLVPPEPAVVVTRLAGSLGTSGRGGPRVGTQRFV
jgi:hypothetical protein